MMWSPGSSSPPAQGPDRERNRDQPADRRGVGGLFALITSRRYQLKGSTYRYQLQSNSAMELTDSDDQYLRSTTTQTRKPDNRTGGGLGGGGFGGGSGVHTGGSGTSHGGGGGKF